jgi:hypothetical protein
MKNLKSKTRIMKSDFPNLIAILDIFTLMCEKSFYELSINFKKIQLTLKKFN